MLIDAIIFFLVFFSISILIAVCLKLDLVTFVDYVKQKPKVYGSLSAYFSQPKTVFNMAVDSLFCCYSIVFIGSVFQATPGMRCMEIHVVKQHSPIVSYWDAAMRVLIYRIPNFLAYALMIITIVMEKEMSKYYTIFGGLLSLILIGIWYLPIAFTGQKTGMHDMICGTRVIKGKAVVHP